jgi:hypothetical protein
MRGPRSRPFRDHGDRGPLDALPGRALEDANDGERKAVCDVICTVIAWPGFAASVPTKVLHKRRPPLIPILDNEAIFGAYMSPTWQEQRALDDSVYSPSRIREALDWISSTSLGPENRDVWPARAQAHPARTRIELFDIARWMRLLSIQPVARPT